MRFSCLPKQSPLGSAYTTFDSWLCPLTRNVTYFTRTVQRRNPPQSEGLKVVNGHPIFFIWPHFSVQIKNQLGFCRYTCMIDCFPGKDITCRDIGIGLATSDHIKSCSRAISLCACAICDVSITLPGILHDRGGGGRHATSRDAMHGTSITTV